MIELLSGLSAAFIVITIAVSLVLLGLVIRDKVQHRDDKTTYSRKRTHLIYGALLTGYVGALINHSIVFAQSETDLVNFLLSVFFYVSTAALITYFALKKTTSDKNNSNLDEEDYHAVQFIIVIIVGFMPLVLVQ